MKANYGKPKKDGGFPIIAPSKKAVKQQKNQVKTKKAERGVAKKGRT